MALPLATLAPIVGSIAQTGMQVRGQRRTNQANRQLAREERQWNENMWKAQNAYNTPTKQMQRFKDAGLNPHLIYNQGNPGNASEVKGFTRAKDDNPMQGFAPLDNYIDLRAKTAQTDNLKANTEATNQLSAVRAIDALNKTIDGKQKALDLGLSKDTYDYSVEMAKHSADTALSNARIKKTDAEMAQLLKDPKVQKIKLEVQRAKENLRGEKLTNALRKASLNLRKYGVTESDNVILRWLMQNHNEIIDGINNFQNPNSK